MKNEKWILEMFMELVGNQVFKKINAKDDGNFWVEEELLSYENISDFFKISIWIRE